MSYATLTAAQVGDAVSHLHAWLETRAGAWGELAQTIGRSPGPLRHRQLQALDAELRDHLLPYMELEEALLDDGIPPTATLEHRAIRRAAQRIHHIATAGELHPHLVQAAVASLYLVVADHLQHERLIYLPELTTS